MISWSAHRREIKKKAKLALFDGNMLKGIFMTMLLTLFSSIALAFLPIAISIESFSQPPVIILPSELNADFWALVTISIVLYLLLTSPLSIGIRRFFLRAMRDEKPKFRVALSPFADFREIIGSCALTLLVNLCTAIVFALLLSVPTVLMFLSPDIGPLATIISAPLSFLAAFGILVVTAPFPLAQIIYAEDSSRGVWKSFKMAISRSRGVKIELVLFQLSFLPWMFLAFIFPFGMLLLNPYLSAAYSGFWDTIDVCK